MKSTKWLPGWTLCTSEELTLPYMLNPHACRMMQEIGKILFHLHALPAYSQFEVMEILRHGTSGNFAIRNDTSALSFMVTGRGAHKGNLALTDFSCIFSINWKKKKLFCSSPPGREPSTDSLLVAKTFALNTKIRAWAHIHIPIETPYSIAIEYPVLQEKDWDTIHTLVKNGVRAINMIDHDLMRKNGVADGTADAAIIIGEDTEETFARTVSLVQDVLERKKL